MKKEIFTGVCTALVTPFKKNGKIDYDALEKLILRQIDNKVNAILILGSTGEGSTILEKERKKIIKFARALINPPTKLFVGTGCNNTIIATKYTLQAESLGADGVLIVTPYYNKCNQNGAFLHYEYIAKKTHLPIILYNVPSRTGFNLSVETVSKLTKIKNIVGIKEANEDLEHIDELTRQVGDKIAIYSGNDSLNRYFLTHKASGMVSVLSNVYPDKLIQQYENLQNERLISAEDELLNFSKALFIDVNPMPVKYVLFKMGLIKYNYRLPLTKLDTKDEIRLDKIFNLNKMK